MSFLNQSRLSLWTSTSHAKAVDSFGITPDLSANSVGVAILYFGLLRLTVWSMYIDNIRYTPNSQKCKDAQWWTLGLINRLNDFQQGKSVAYFKLIFQ